jgi:hypothetical protein
VKNKFCVFCGKSPRKDTKEHIIPRWLIQLTGDPYREGIFGPFRNQKTSELERKRFRFDSFAFPACEDCNKRYSELESGAKVMMQELLAGNRLSSSDIELLLTWLDKVRVGSWLISYSVQKNPLGISPLFYINRRVDACDRMVLIYRSDFKGARLSIEGSTVPVFQLQPSCFCLIVNDFVLLNVSTDFLASERLGLPYASSTSFTDSAGISVSVVSGRESIRTPLVRLRYDQRCSQIFQPMFTRTDIRTSFPFYDTDYVKSVSRDHSKGIGKVFVMDPPLVEEYPSYKSDKWLPKWIWNDNALRRTIRKQMLDFQLQLLEYGASDRKVSYKEVKTKTQRNIIRARMRIAKQVNRLLLRRIQNPLPG